jgi:uncharacterized protein involved in propanediol utilization
MKAQVSVTQCGHHGEILQGLFQDTVGRYQVALLTLPWSGCRSTVSLTRASGTSTIHGPGDKKKALAAAELAKHYIGIPQLGALMTISSNIPDGVGMGSSSADTTAAILAVAKMADVAISSETVGRLAVQAEGATDAIMFGQGTVLFASRQGMTLEKFAAPLPHFFVVGFCSGDPVATLSQPVPRYDAKELQTFCVLRAALRRALEEGDARMIARIATHSAELNERYCPKPLFSFVRHIAEKHGALGIQVAHTGSAMGILFDPRDAQLERRVKAATAELDQIGIQSWSFSTREPGGMNAQLNSRSWRGESRITTITR